MHIRERSVHDEIGGSHSATLKVHTWKEKLLNRPLGIRVIYLLDITRFWVLKHAIFFLAGETRLEMYNSSSLYFPKGGLGGSLREIINNLLKNSSQDIKQYYSKEIEYMEEKEPFY